MQERVEGETGPIIEIESTLPPSHSSERHVCRIPFSRVQPDAGERFLFDSIEQRLEFICPQQAFHLTDE